MSFSFIWLKPQRPAHAFSVLMGHLTASKSHNFATEVYRLSYAYRQAICEHDRRRKNEGEKESNWWEELDDCKNNETT